MNHRWFPVLLEPVVLGACMATISLCIWTFGHRQFGAFDFSILVETGWRLFNGQRPYHDFIMTMPVGFYLGAEAAFRIWGVRWSALVAMTAAFSIATFLIHARLLRRLVPWTYGTVLALACQMLGVVAMSYWWYNCIAIIAACLFLTAALAFIRYPQDRTVRLWFGACLALLLLMKPNIAGLLIALVCGGLFLYRPCRVPALGLLLAGFAAVSCILWERGINPLEVLASYWGLVVSRGVPSGNFFLLNHREEAFVSLPLILLSLIPYWVTANGIRSSVGNNGVTSAEAGWPVLKPELLLMRRLALVGLLVGAFSLFTRREDVFIAVLVMLLGLIPLVVVHTPDRLNLGNRAVAWLALAGLATVVLGIHTNRDEVSVTLLMVLLLVILLVALAWDSRAERWVWESGKQALGWISLLGMAMVVCRIVTDPLDMVILLFLTLLLLIPLEAVVSVIWDTFIAAKPGWGSDTLITVWMALAGSAVGVISLVTNIETTLVSLPLFLIGGTVSLLVLVQKDALRNRIGDELKLAGIAALLTLAVGFWLRTHWLEQVAMVTRVDIEMPSLDLLVSSPKGMFLLELWMVGLLITLGCGNGLRFSFPPGAGKGSATTPQGRLTLWQGFTPLAVSWTTVIICGLVAFVAGAERWRVMYIGPFFENGGRPLTTLSQPPFLEGLWLSPRARQVVNQIGKVLQARRSQGKKDSILFGSRLEFAYAAFGIPSPRRMPIWWDAGTSFPLAMTGEVLAQFAVHRFSLCILARDPVLRLPDFYGLPREIVRELKYSYTPVVYPEIVVFERLPAGRPVSKHLVWVGKGLFMSRAEKKR